MFRCICFIDTIEVKKVGRIENRFSFFLILFGKHPKPLHICIYRYPAVGTLVSFEYDFATPFVEIGFLELPSLQACGVAFAIFIENFLPNFRRFCFVVFLDCKLLKGFCPHIKDFIIVIGIVAPVPSRSKRKSLYLRRISLSASANTDEKLLCKASYTRIHGNDVSSSHIFSRYIFDCHIYCQHSRLAGFGVIST